MFIICIRIILHILHLNISIFIYTMSVWLFVGRFKWKANLSNVLLLNDKVHYLKKHFHGYFIFKNNYYFCSYILNFKKNIIGLDCNRNEIETTTQ